MYERVGVIFVMCHRLECTSELHAELGLHAHAGHNVRIGAVPEKASTLQEVSCAKKGTMGSTDCLHTQRATTDENLEKHGERA